MTDAAAFIRAGTAISSHALVPAIRLHLATEITPIWKATEAWLAETGTAPPFWAFAWPGSAAMARHILDHPELVRGRRVLDFAAGCGLAAIACAMAGARTVAASEIDRLACEAVALNAGLNGVTVDILGDVVGDVVGSDRAWDLILCGDVCYEAPMTGRIMPWLRTRATAAEVWIADPGRAYLPKDGLTALLTMAVPTTMELEDHAERRVTLWRLSPARNHVGPVAV